MNDETKRVEITEDDRVFLELWNRYLDDPERLQFTKHAQEVFCATCDLTGPNGERVKKDARITLMYASFCAGVSLAVDLMSTDGEKNGGTI